MKYTLKNRYKTSFTYRIRFTTVCILLGACSEFIQVESPPTQISTEAVFNDDAAATSAIRGIYSSMFSTSGFASGSISSVTFLAGRSSDEFTNYSNGQVSEFSSNNLSENNTLLSASLWNEMYQYIYYANTAISGLTTSTKVTESVRKQLLGEAKFIRAFCNFYLTNLFGNVPLITSTSYEKNRTVKRVTTNEIYQSIIADLLDSQDLLSTDYSNSSGERVRPNQWTAKAFLARVYLFTNDYANEELLSTQIIGNETLYSLESDLNNVFLKNSNESIWQLLPIEGSINTKEGSSFILTTAPSNVALSEILLNSFESGDLRKTDWIGQLTANTVTYYYPFKYKIKNGATLKEYSTIFRLAEQYLIRAEARVQLDNLSGAIADLDKIRERAGLSLINSVNPEITKADLLSAILEERKHELFAEWGHRWLDLKRTQTAAAALSPIKPNWQGTDVIYPIPRNEINNNTNLLPQNPGY